MNTTPVYQSPLPDLLSAVTHGIWTLLDGPIGLTLLGVVALWLLVAWLGLVKRRFDDFCRRG